MKHVLVTGGTGFVGPHLVSALRSRGCVVRVLALANEDTRAIEGDNVVIFRGDIRQPGTLVGPFCGVDTVFHLAAIHGLWRPRQQYYDINVAGTENVCQAALQAGVRRVVHVSSWAVYGMDLGQPVTEDFPLRPFPDIYMTSKTEADELVRKYIARDHLPAVIIRPGTMFGPGDSVNFARLADRVGEGKAIIIGSGRNALPFVYVTDAVEGMILAGFNDAAAGNIYNISNDEPLTQEQMWTAIAEELHVVPPRFRAPYYLLYVMASLAERAAKLYPEGKQPLVTRLGVKMYGTDNRHPSGKARRELGYVPRVSVREGVHLAASWYLNRRAGVVTHASAMAGSVA